MPAAAELDLELDPAAAAPLYHQIVQAIRWKIGTGSLRPGDLLPSLRDAAARWNVSYHTVRHAYRELAKRGLVGSVRGDGTRVLGAPAEAQAPGSAPGLEDFVREVALEAGRRFGARPEDLVRTLAELGAPAERTPRRITLVECNEHQCADLAGQVEARWRARVLPWNLRQEGEPPAGPLVGTWFHYGEMRSRWPRRVDDMCFTSLRLDPAVVDRVAAALGGDGPHRVVLYEADLGTARQHAADLLAALSFEVELEPRAGLPDPSVLTRGADLAVVAPRLWGELPEAARQRTRVVELRHVFEPGDLSALGKRLGLTAAALEGRSERPGR